MFRYAPLDDDCQEDRRGDGWRPQQATRPNAGMKDEHDDKNTEFYTEWFSVCPNITLKFRKMAKFCILKSFIKQNND
jgi:hypothetical protein